MGLKSRYLKIAVVLGIAFVVTTYIGIGCSHGGDTVVFVTQPVTSVIPEAPYCTLSQSFTGLVSGNAVFNIRASSSAGLGAEIPGGPIKYAEIQILDESGHIIQCGETDGTGSFSLSVPPNRSLTVAVNSRSFNSHLQASILNDPSHNNYYSLSKAFTSGTNVNIGTLTASAKGNLMGGAFNIHFNLLRANESLRYYVCRVDVNTPCSGFSVAPKVTTYWVAGVNPYTYFGGDASSGLSFYVPGTDKLYILGGINGDTDSSDTDHFDDSIISHEYGHFIEDHYAKTDSPGGSHDGNHILDARLMWGEGWANFFSSAVRADRVYRDTFGNIDGPNGASGTGCFFNYDVDLNSNFGSALDVAAAAGEGNFREFAVTRALWDAVDPIKNSPTGVLSGVDGGGGDDNVNDSIHQPFGNFFATFSGADFPTPAEHFRNVGLFLKINNDSVVNGSNVLTFEKLTATTKDYGQPLPASTSGGCAGTSISISANDPASCNLGGQLICTRGNLNHCCSNQFASNDFYDVNYDGSFSTISLNRVSGAAEIDLYLYRDGYVFGQQSDIVRSAIGTSSASSRSISLSGLSAGHYMLNVNVYTGNGNPAVSAYQLFVGPVGTNQVCP